MNVWLRIENHNGQGYLVVAVTGNDLDGLNDSVASIPLSELKEALEMEGAA